MYNAHYGSFIESSPPTFSNHKHNNNNSYQMHENGPTIGYYQNNNSNNQKNFNDKRIDSPLIGNRSINKMQNDAKPYNVSYNSSNNFNPNKINF
jgi:hypothetical protein